MMGTITSKTFTDVGKYSILVPRSKNLLFLDARNDDENQKPTTGERMAVLERGGQIVPHGDLGISILYHQ